MLNGMATHQLNLNPEQVFY